VKPKAGKPWGSAFRAHREAEKPEPVVSPLVAETDLRNITRRSDRLKTVVRIHLNWETKRDWLVLGETQIRAQKDGGGDGRWRLEAYLGKGVTDFEHDSAYAVRLPLIGLQLGPLAVSYHRTELFAWVDPNEDPAFSPDFRVPRPGYNPMTHPDIHVCKTKGCLEDNPKGHIIVPQGFYVPPFDAELYEAVRGKKVEISIGPVYEKDE